MGEVRALVVDDEDDMRVLTSAVIDTQNQGLRVVGEARDGREALERVDELQPDAVVLDQRMPGMSGVETARVMLSNHPNVRVILYSAYLDDATIAEGREAGIGHFVTKMDERALLAALWAGT